MVFNQVQFQQFNK